MKLDAKNHHYYLNLEKGYKGELQFDKWLEPHLKNKIILHDILLEHNNTIFQIDSLLITSNTIYLFEIKNYEGDFYIEGGRWFSLSNTEIKDPLLQIRRTESIFRRLLEELTFTFPIETYLIFVNPEFQLYQTPLNLPLVFSTQLHRFSQKLEKYSSSLLTDTHIKLAKQLLSLHLTESPYTRLPHYQFDTLKKGIYCPLCLSFYSSFPNKKTLKCNKCGSSENYHNALLRNIEEFIFLFPKRKVTTNIIHEWCSIIKSKKTIRKILSQNYKQIGHSSSSHYVRYD
jgi:hypothetical protein